MVVAAVALLVAGPGVARAHISPDPSEALAGSEESISFTVEHGCDGSPTVQLDMQVPDGVSDIVPEPADGWSASVDGQVVTFVGGPLPDDEELTFAVRMLLPDTPDVTIHFPFVQRCEVGEIRWIDVPTDGAGSELDEPAPALRLVSELSAAGAADGTDTGHGDHGDHSDHSDDAGDDEGGLGAGVIAALVAGGIAVVAGVVFALRRRTRS